MKSITDFPKDVQFALNGLSRGNSGALEFLLNLMEYADDDLVEIVVNKLMGEQVMTGSYLGVLYNDLCDKDLQKVRKLCVSCPISVMIDACSRSDSSGVELVKEYFV